METFTVLGAIIAADIQKEFHSFLWRDFYLM